MELEVQNGFAYMIGRLVAAEKALQTTVSSNRRGQELADILRVNLTMARENLPSNLQLAGISVELLATAEEGFDASMRAALRGAVSGKFLLPDR